MGARLLRGCCKAAAGPASAPNGGGRAPIRAPPPAPAASGPARLARRQHAARVCTAGSGSRHTPKRTPPPSLPHAARPGRDALALALARAQAVAHAGGHAQPQPHPHPLAHRQALPLPHGRAQVATWVAAADPP
jgi:hypothetical protein